MNLPIQLAFEHDYDVEYIDEAPGTPVDNQFWFPGPSKRGGQDGLHLQVKPISGKEWIGVFPFGAGGAFGIYSTPNSEVLCVLSAGNLYFIDSKEPKETWSSSGYGSQIYQLPELNLLVVSESDAIRAYGKDGVFWQTEGICSPEIELITSTKIEGACEDCGKDVRFAVDTASGKVIYLERAN